MNTVARVVSGLVGVFFSAGAFADSSADVPHATVSLISQYEVTAPGATQWIGIHFKPKDGWHVYWRNPGDSGLPPRAEFSAAPAGSNFGPLEFPTPDRIPYGPLVNYAYEGEVLYPVSWTASSDAKVGENVVITANVKWLICKEECVPGKASLSLRLPIVAPEGLAGASSTHRSLFAETLSSLPKSEAGKVRVSLSTDGTRLELAVRDGAFRRSSKSTLRSVFFFSENGIGVGADSNQVAKSTPDGFILSVPRKDLKPIGEVRGVLKVGEGKSFQIAEVLDASLLAPTAGASVPSGTSATALTNPSLALMLLFAFLGGLILNLMPCILPVLSIKVLGMANQSGANRAAVRNHGLAFTAGILISFWILAGVFLALRASGQSLGWGFQLQNPVFVAGLTVLFYAMSLNLFGIFEIGDRWMGAGGKLAAKEGYAGSFFTGVLTTVAATPCSAPFMGSALGFALTQPADVAVLVLTTLALGLAFPYLLFSFLPAASRILPRPGMWMKTLKEILAFPLLATVVWLVGVVGGQAGIEGITRVLGTLLLVTMIAWLYGKAVVRVSVKWGLITVLAGLSLAAIGSLTRESTPPSASPFVHGPWKAWTPEAQARAIAEGKTVFVNFTAQWCVTCKVNETLVFDRSAVRAALGDPSVTAFVADWTNSDRAITEALAKVGRNSVPVYVIYRPGVATPKVLPQILSVDLLLAELGKGS